MKELRAKMAELLEGYTVENGIIRDLGKFECEPVETLYYYDCYLNGAGAIFEVTQEEKEYFDIPMKWIYLAESNDGFISLVYFDSEIEAENYQYEAEGADDYD